MTNKFIQAKLKEFRERFTYDGVVAKLSTNNGIAFPIKSSELEQFIQEAWEQAYQHGQQDILGQSYKVPEQEECNGTCRYAGNVCVIHCQKPEQKTCACGGNPKLTFHSAGDCHNKELGITKVKTNHKNFHT